MYMCKHFHYTVYLNFLLCIGLPIPIVATSASVSHEHYGINDRYRRTLCHCKFIKQCRCWISEEKGAIWAFIGPMILIILVIQYVYDLCGV